MRTRSKVILATAVAVPVVIGGAGAAYANHYQDRALPGTTVAGASVSGMTRDEVADLIQKRADAVEISLTGEGATRTQHLSQLGYPVDVDATVAAVFDANSNWSEYPKSLLSPRDVAVVVRHDAATTEKFVDDLIGKDGKLAKDAGVALNKAGTAFEVTPAVAGKSVVPSSFQDVVAAAAKNLRNASATLEFAEIPPSVTTADATKVADEANALIDTTVQVSDGQSKDTASVKEKASWITIPDKGGVLGTPTIDAAKISAWVAAVAKDANRAPVNGTRTVDSAGTVRSVITQASDGRRVTNADAVAKAMAANLATGKDYSGTFAYKKLPATWSERRIAAGAENLAYPAADGEKWVDVNLTKKTMTAYIGAKKVYGPIEMVDGGKDFPTVVGTYHVYLKYEKMTMRGTNADGTKYETPDVPWVSFFYQGIALHGAPWRDSFGYSGSHGCVNLPVAAAKWVYDFAPVGTPVVSHR